MVKLNEYQTPLEDLKLHLYPQEVQDDFMEYITTVPFIRNLISPNRPHCKDLPRDEEGKAIIDITNPPILDDMDYFRPTARHWEKEGTLTNLRPNPNPNSEFGRWLRREVDRIWNGMVRESDGMWITGDEYFYLNYSLIEMSEEIEGTDIADRIIAMPKVWEGVWWRHLYWYKARRAALNAAEIAKRGASKSYSVASKLTKIFILGDTFKSSRGVKAMVVAYAKEYLTKDGTLNKFEFMIDSLQELAPWWPSKRLQSSLSDMNWQMGYIDSATGGKRGTKNLILGVAVKDDPDKPRGKRSVFIAGEEFGAFPKIADTYNVMLPSVREGNKAFGMMALIGTGGSEGNDFSGAMEMIYKPKGYHILGLPNVWDKVNKGIGESIFFFPAYINRAGCYDGNGNSDVTKALLEILMDWYNAKYNTSDPMQVVRTKAENPITIQDAIMRRDNTVFPVADLVERIGELDANPSEFDDVYVGQMHLKTDGTPYFKPSMDKPLREFPHKGNKHEGAVEIFKMPEKNRDGRIFTGRYIGGLDPIDNDLARSTTSLISFFILDLFTDQIVAEWTGRLDMADDGYEICRRLAIFYNAKICYENNKKGLYSYFKTMNSLYLLAPNLEFLKDRDKVKGENYGNTAYGVNAGTFVNDFARERLNNWFRKPVKKTIVQDGQEVEITKMNLYYCRNRALLQEASQWNPDGNFDRVSACGMLMLYREDRLIAFGGNPQEAEKKKKKAQAEEDDYFDRNWHRKE
jgi:hypothetical protein